MDPTREELLANWLRSHGFADEYIAMTLNWRTGEMQQGKADPKDNVILAYVKALAQKNVERLQKETALPGDAVRTIEHEYRHLIPPITVPWGLIILASSCASLVGALVGSMVLHVWG
jgi:hypothetical protein